MARQHRPEAPRPAPAVAPKAEPIVPMRLVAPYSYYEEDGTAKNWDQGQVITDPAEIKHLMERGAHVVPHEVES